MRLHILSLAAAAMLVTSCSDDFLTNTPQGVLNDEVIGSTEGVELLCNAAYAGLGGPNEQDNGCFYPASNWAYGEVRSDNAYKGGGGTGDVIEIHRMEIFDVDANNWNIDNKWYRLYCSLQRCNTALRVLRAHSDQEVAHRASRIAEMRVLRAHFFFELQRLFGKVPYFDENVGTTDYVTVPNDRYTRHELLGFIADELLEAAEDLPETQPEVGRVNKNVALAYAAKVKLYQAYRQDPATNAVTEIDRTLMAEVVTLVDRVLATGRYDLLPDFQGLDLIANENGVESVFAVQYSMNDGSSSAGRINWSNLLNSPGGDSPYHGDGFFLPSQDLINAYQTDAQGLPVFDYQELPDYSVVVFDKDADGNQTFSLSNVAHTVDPRLDFVVGRPTITWKTYTDSPCMLWVRDQGAYGYNCAKRFWVSPESGDMYQGWPWGASSLNWQIIRTVDLLLWKAEALIELGTDLDQARQLINRIRRRAAESPCVADFNDPSQPAANYLIAEYPAQGWTQDYARRALRTEMRLEKALEGERFFDLVRWGIAEPVMNAYIAAEQDTRIYYAGAAFTAHRDEYLPVPTQQYNFSEGRYTQNPGYPSF